MSKLIMMVGLPGSGKSTYAEKIAKEFNATVFSSDALRKELYGSEAVQDHNEEVFDILMKRMSIALERGENVVFDAMNINSKNRRHTLRMIDRYHCEKYAMVVATPYEVCLERNAKRERNVPEWAIKRAYMNFTMPTIREGFDKVGFIYHKDQTFENPVDAAFKSKDISHENHHHEYTIGFHMEAASEYLKEHYPEESKDYALRIATLIHDIGKPFTKTFYNMKGERTEEAHYYNHNNVGAYESMFLDIDGEYRIEIALLILYHMHYYMSWNQSSKAAKRDRDFLGEDLCRKLDILHDCDLHAH